MDIILYLVMPYVRCYNLRKERERTFMFRQGNIISYGNKLGLTVIDDSGHYYGLQDSRGNTARVEKILVNANGKLMSDYIKGKRDAISKIVDNCYTLVSRNYATSLHSFIKPDIRTIVEAYYTQDFRKAEKTKLYSNYRNVYYSILSYLRANHPY